MRNFSSKVTSRTLLVANSTTSDNIRAVSSCSFILPNCEFIPSRNCNIQIFLGDFLSDLVHLHFRLSWMIRRPLLFNHLANCSRGTEKENSNAFYIIKMANSLRMTSFLSLRWLILKQVVAGTQLAG